MDNNANRAIMISVFVFITIAIVSSVLLLYSYGKQIGQSTGEVTNIAGNVEKDDKARFNNILYKGADVKSTIYKYQDDPNLKIVLKDKNGVTINGDVIPSLKNASGVIEQSKIDTLISTVQNYQSSYTDFNNTITFQLSNAIQGSALGAAITGGPTIGTPIKGTYDTSVSKFNVTVELDKTYSLTDRNYYSEIKNRDTDAIEKSNSLTAKSAIVKLAEGNYTISAYYIDRTGKKSDQSVLNFTISNAAPTISSITTSDSTLNSTFDVNAGVVYIGANKTITLTASATDPDGDALTYLWTITANGSGTPQTYSSATTGSYTFSNGYYSVVVKVSDPAGKFVEKIFVIFAQSQSSVFDSFTSGTIFTAETPVVSGYKVATYMFYANLPDHGGSDTSIIEGWDGSSWEKIPYNAAYRAANTSYTYTSSYTILNSSNSANSASYVSTIDTSKSYSKLRFTYTADQSHAGRNCFSNKVFSYSITYKRS